MRPGSAAVGVAAPCGSAEWPQAARGSSGLFPFGPPPWAPHGTWGAGRRGERRPRREGGAGAEPGLLEGNPDSWKPPSADHPRQIHLGDLNYKLLQVEFPLFIFKPVPLWVELAIFINPRAKLLSFSRPPPNPTPRPPEVPLPPRPHGLPSRILTAAAQVQAGCPAGHRNRPVCPLDTVTTCEC